MHLQVLFLSNDHSEDLPRQPHRPQCGSRLTFHVLASFLKASSLCTECQTLIRKGAATTHDSLSAHLKTPTGAKLLLITHSRLIYREVTVHPKHREMGRVAVF